ncbi:hypothetical protein Tco_0832462 [Tanacetum coccineum]
MAQKIPNLDKEVNPHNDSKIKHLQNKYNPISEMLMQSGCQWDDVENKINCQKQWYDDWCKTHKNATGLFNFKFPYLHKLDMVWGRDRATGLKAEDISEACEDTNNQATTVLCSSDDSGDEVLMVPETHPETQPGPSTIHATNKEEKKKTVWGEDADDPTNFLVVLGESEAHYMRSRHHEQMDMEDGYREQQKDIQDDDDMDQSSGAKYDMFGQLLEQILQTHPHLLPAVIDQQLENLQNERDAQKEEVAPSWQIAFTNH